MKLKKINIPGFYVVQRPGRVRRLGEDHLAEPEAWKVKMLKGELTAYKIKPLATL
jgi:hypothetical protein